LPCANVSRSTASGHLSKLVAARLLTITRSRRFQLLRIASPCRTMLESIKVVAAHRGATPPSAAVSKRRHALRFAEVATIIWLARSESLLPMPLVAMGHIVLTDEGGEVTSSGRAFLFRVRRRSDATDSAGFSVSLVSTGGERRYHLKRTRRSSDFWIVSWSSDGSNVCRAAAHSN